MSELPKFSYAIIEDAILDDVSLHPGAVNLYARLTIYEKLNISWPKLDYFAKKHNVSVRCIQLWLAQLKKSGYIIEKTYDEDAIVKFLKSKKPIKFDCPIHFPIAICEWCDSETYCLSRHHYPKRKTHGGSAIVNICGNCHQEFHFLCDYPKYTLTKEAS